MRFIRGNNNAVAVVVDAVGNAEACSRVVCHLTEGIQGNGGFDGEVSLVCDGTCDGVVGDLAEGIGEEVVCCVFLEEGGVFGCPAWVLDACRV